MTDPTQRMREILRSFHAFTRRDIDPFVTRPMYDMETAVAELSKLLDEARLDEIKMVQQVLRGGRLPVVASIFDSRIAALQQPKQYEETA